MASAVVVNYGLIMALFQLSMLILSGSTVAFGDSDNCKFFSVIKHCTTYYVCSTFTNIAN